MITLKHLCREFDVDPPKLRRTLRNAKLIPTGGRWKWEEKSKEVAKVREKLTKLLAPVLNKRGPPAPSGPPDTSSTA